MDERQLAELKGFMQALIQQSEDKLRSEIIAEIHQEARSLEAKIGEISAVVKPDDSKITDIQNKVSQIDNRVNLIYAKL